MSDLYQSLHQSLSFYFRIIVEDTNENAPVFDMASYSASLEENLPPGTVVTRVSLVYILTDTT